MPVLSDRLRKIAEFINRGERVADVGTDHGYLPIFLREQDICPFVIASDIRVSPLNSAIKNVKKAGADGIDFRLCDGLLGIEKDEIDTVVIAGMGGECIAGILGSSTWAKGSGKHFILQPMNSPEELRKYLCRFGYTIKQECAVRDAGRIYTVMDVYATPDSEKHGEDFYYTGKLSPQNDCDREFLEKQYIRLKSCADSLEKTEKREEYLHYLGAAQHIADYLKRV